MAAEVSKGIAGALNLANDPASAALLRSAQEAFMEAWRQAMWAGVVVMALLLVFVLLRGPQPQEALA